MLEELRLARERIDLLTRELEDSRAEAAALRDVVAELEEARRVLTERNRELESKTGPHPAPEAAAPRPGKGGYLSESSVRAIREALDMKTEKIGSFRGRTDMDPEAAADIVAFLKTDIAVCEALLDIDFSSTESVVVGFGRIEGIMKNSLSPMNQALYVLSLDDEEAEIEFRFSQVLGGVQEMMAAFDRSGSGSYD